MLFLLYYSYGPYYIIHIVPLEILLSKSSQIPHSSEVFLLSPHWDIIGTSLPICVPFCWYNTIFLLWFIVTFYHSVQFSSVSQSCQTLRPHELQHARPPCPSPTPRVHSNSRPSSQWCHPAISSSAIPFSSCPQSLPASKSFPMSQLFTSGGQSTGVSALASFLPKNTQGWSPLEWTGWIALQSKGLSRVFANTTV